MTLKETDSEYIEKVIYNKLIGDEKLIQLTKKILRVYFTSNIKDCGLRDVKFDLKNDVVRILILKMIREFLCCCGLFDTMKTLEIECSDIIDGKSVDFDEVMTCFENLNSIVDRETNLEKLLCCAVYFKRNNEIDQVTNSALIEASSCIESMKNEIEGLHHSYLEQVNMAREIMEEKVKEIERLYVKSIGD